MQGAADRLSAGSCGAERTAPESNSFGVQGIEVRGVELMADRSGGLYWPAERTLIVADLHLEKGSAHARRGVMLPPYDTQETLRRLSEVIERTQPLRIVALGDSFHDREAAGRLALNSRRALADLQAGRTWVWVRGNHDPEIEPGLGGEVVDVLDLGGLRLQHAPSEGVATGEIAGHLHPAARISVRGSVIRRPCFVGDGQRLVMPAFGAFTGGLNVLDAAFRPLFGGDGLKVWMLGQDGIYGVASRLLGPD